MKILQNLHTCPRCTRGKLTFDHLKRYECPECGWVYFQNAAAAAGCLFEKKEKILFIKRNRNPGKGLLDIPGGFVDPGEGVEEALRRELQEELGMEPGRLDYCGSFGNVYEYKGIQYITCDIFFKGTLEKLPPSFDEEEIAELIWRNPAEVTQEELAFLSLKQLFASWPPASLLR